MGGRGLDTQRRRAGFFCVVALRRVGDYISERRHTARIRLYEALPEHTASASGMGGSVLKRGTLLMQAWRAEQRRQWELLVEQDAKRRCPKCKKEKRVAEFYCDRNNCRKCHNRRTWDDIKAHNTPERTARRADKNKLWKQVNRERHAELNRLYAKRNRQRVSVRARKYAFVRRARQRAAQGRASAQQIMWRVQMFGERCWICSAPYEHVDHVKPLAKGGSNWPANLRPICRGCNARKAAKWPYDKEAA